MKIIFPCMLLFLLLTRPATCATHSNDQFNFLLKQAGIEKSQFHPYNARNGKLLVTNLDDMRYWFRFIRTIVLSNGVKNAQHLYQYNWQLGKIQKPRSWQEFPCSLNGSKSLERPTSVNRLRPGDIDVIAAIGDSLSAGNGVLSETLLDLIKEFRSLAFSGGGKADWRTVQTLPNILKVFNPMLYGFATDDVVVADKGSYLNVAEPMIMSRDLVFQAQVVIQRMANDPNIDMINHWKLLTIFVGNNDVCSDLCHHDNWWNFLKQHEADLRRTFTVLRDSVPRLVINLIPVPNLVELRSIGEVTWQCAAVHYFGCHCIFGHRYDKIYLRKVADFINRWQHIDEFVASLSEFQTDDFAVLYQPFMANISYLEVDGETDFRYFSSDCFHFSQLGHAAVASNLWNNMMQPYGMKQQIDSENPFGKFECPTEERPFIATLGNS